MSAPLPLDSASHISQYKDKRTGEIPYRPVLPVMDRILLQPSVGTTPHAQMLRAIKFYGTVVAPAVQKAMA